MNTRGFVDDEHGGLPLIPGQFFQGTPGCPGDERCGSAIERQQLVDRRGMAGSHQRLAGQSADVRV